MKCHLFDTTNEFREFVWSAMSSMLENLRNGALCYCRKQANQRWRMQRASGTGRLASKGVRKNTSGNHIGFRAERLMFRTCSYRELVIGALVGRSPRASGQVSRSSEPLLYRSLCMQGVSSGIRKLSENSEPVRGQRYRVKQTWMGASIFDSDILMYFLALLHM